MRPDPLWRRLMRYLSIILLAGPLAGLTVVWAVVSVLSLTPDRNHYIEMGDRIMVSLVVLAGVGLVLEFLIIPLIMAEPRRRIGKSPPDPAKASPTKADHAQARPGDDIRP